MNRNDAARVKKLEAEVLRLRNEIYAIKEPYEVRSAESMVGLCFKVRNNYSCPEKPSDYWWLYAKVLAAEDGGLRCLRFETDKNGDVRVQTFTFDMRGVYDSYQTISPDEFDRAYARMLKHLEKANSKARGAA